MARLQHVAQRQAIAQYGLYRRITTARGGGEVWTFQIGSVVDAGDSAAAPRVSLLVPVRNEEENLTRNLPLLLQSDYEPLEIILLDDESTDSGRAVAERLMASSNKDARWVKGKPWTPELRVSGKSNACQQLAELASGEVLIFCDADVAISRHAVSRTVKWLQHSRSAGLTALPQQRFVGSRERLALPWIMQLPIAMTVPFFWSWRSGVRSLQLANGQWLALRAQQKGLALRFVTGAGVPRRLRGDPLRYARRLIGRHYAPAQLRSALADGVTLICGDALDPPLVPHGFARVVACNLLDSVRSPAGLLSVVDGLCAPQGELLLASPYSWQSGVVAEGARLGGAAPAADLRAMLTSGGIGLAAGLEAAYTLEDERELPWELRRDTRSAHAYTVHFLRARKTG